MSNKQVAYFRHFAAKHQCELVFPIKTEINNYGLIDEDVHAVRQETDTIQSLFEHIRNKIVYMIQKENVLKEESSANRDEIKISLNMSLTKNGSKVSGTTVCRDLINQGKNNEINFKIADEEFYVVVNAPLIESLTLPSILFLYNSVQYVRFKAVYTDKKSSEFIWYTSKNKEKWVEVSKTYFYKLTENDLNCFLKLRCIPKLEEIQGPPFEVVSESVVEPMPAQPKRCPFQKRQQMTAKKLGGKEFRIVTYNILSDRYTDSVMYPYCDMKYLAIDYRKHLIRKELLGYNADIICLQEVDNKIYNSYYRNEFKKVGYHSVFHKKGNRLTEGLACIFDKSKFKLLESAHFVLIEELKSNPTFEDMWEAIQENEPVKSCILKQATSVQVTALKARNLNEVILVANTHLYYHSEANHIRLIQIGVIVGIINRLCMKQKLKNRKCRLSVIFCGDFNSQPKSGVYELLTKKVIKEDHPEWTSSLDPPICGINLFHPFTFDSACGTPEYTNFTNDFKGCLDYIFYEKTNFSLINYVPLPDIDIVMKHTALPSKVFPSDHLALIADLRWK